MEYNKGDLKREGVNVRKEGKNVADGSAGDKWLGRCSARV
jgi:hypothetical protein